MVLMTKLVYFFGFFFQNCVVWYRNFFLQSVCVICCTNVSNFSSFPAPPCDFKLLWKKTFLHSILWRYFSQKKKMSFNFFWATSRILLKMNIPLIFFLRSPKNDLKDLYYLPSSANILSYIHSKYSSDPKVPNSLKKSR